MFHTMSKPFLRENVKKGGGGGGGGGISKCHLMIVIPTMLIVTGLGIRNMIYAGVLQNPNWSYFEEFICDYGY